MIMMHAINMLIFVAILALSMPTDISQSIRRLFARSYNRSVGHLPWCIHSFTPYSVMSAIQNWMDIQQIHSLIYQYDYTTNIHAAKQGTFVSHFLLQLQKEYHIIFKARHCYCNSGLLAHRCKKANVRLCIERVSRKADWMKIILRTNTKLYP